MFAGLAAFAGLAVFAGLVVFAGIVVFAGLAGLVVALAGLVTLAAKRAFRTVTSSRFGRAGSSEYSAMMCPRNKQVASCPIKWKLTARLQMGKTNDLGQKAGS